jgi:CheY-like chemotaxis protein
MESSVIPRIFEPYYTTKTLGKGTGLGLAVVHGIVKSIEGDIKIYSEPGKGSSFEIYLPRLPEEYGIEAESVETKPLLQGTEKIMLVDDEEVLVAMLSKQLKGLGYQVTSLTDSIEALGRFRSQTDSYDLVITDQAMPRMTGLELSAGLLQLRPHLPIILCSGFSRALSPKIIQASRIKAVLMKPVTIKELAEKIRYLLDNC